MWKPLLAASIGVTLAVPAQAGSETEIWTAGVAERAGIDAAYFAPPAGFKHISGVLYKDDRFIVLSPGLGEEKNISMLGLMFGLAVTGNRPDNETAGPTEGRCRGEGTEPIAPMTLEHYPALLGDVALALDCAHERKAGRAWETVQLVSGTDSYLMVVTFDRSDPSARVFVDLTEWAEDNL